MKAVAASGLVALLFCGSAAHGGVADFWGHWENPVRSEGGLTHVLISPDGGNRVNVRAYGDCQSVECNWGQVAGQSFTSGPHAKDVDAISATFSTGLFKRQIIFRVADKGRLEFELLTDFPDGSWQHDFVMRGVLKPSAWAGPISENFERPAGTGTGWGGGARSGALSMPEESCTLFIDPGQARIVAQNGLWQLVAGGETLGASRDKRIVLAAETAVKYYGFDRRCSVSGPANAYWKNGGDFPDRKMGGADCLDINPTTAHVVHSGQSWKVVDGTSVIADFGANKSQAEALLALIRLKRLDAQCSVGRPDPILVYWLAR